MRPIVFCRFVENSENYSIVGDLPIIVGTDLQTDRFLIYDGQLFYMVVKYSAKSTGGFSMDDWTATKLELAYEDKSLMWLFEISDIIIGECQYGEKEHLCYAEE